MTSFVFSAILAGTTKGKMSGSTCESKLPKFTADFHSKYTERSVAKLDILNISDAYNALFRNTKTGMDHAADL